MAKSLCVILSAGNMVIVLSMFLNVNTTLIKVGQITIDEWLLRSNVGTYNVG